MVSVGDARSRCAASPINEGNSLHGNALSGVAPKVITCRNDEGNCSDSGSTNHCAFPESASSA